MSFSDTAFCLCKTQIRSDHSHVTLHFALMIMLSLRVEKEIDTINFPTGFRIEKSTQETERSRSVSSLVVMIIGEYVLAVRPQWTCDFSSLNFTSELQAPLYPGKATSKCFPACVSRSGCSLLVVTQILKRECLQGSPADMSSFFSQIH